MTRLRRSIAVLAALLAVLAAFIPPAAATTPPDGGTWAADGYFPSSDGVTMLHADVIRPAGMPLDAQHKTPVLLTVSPYTNHSGQLGVVGLAEGDAAPYDPQGTGPSSRFYDFLTVTHLLQHGYTYVMVDLPGFGGSAGCNDWGGSREQGAVKAAVEWAASQPWSTGKVALFGKSYDGWTGLMGIAQHPHGLAAVVSLEPVYTGYDYEYTQGVRKSTSALEAGLFAAVDATPGTTNDTPMYNANGAPEAWCYGVNVALQQEDDQNSAFWQERDLIKEDRASAESLNTPVFITQGFLEDNTQPERAFDFFNQMTGPKRAWIGQWDHCRPWETYAVCKSGGGNNRPALGRDPSIFAGQVMRFLDYYVKGDTSVPIQQDPPIEVQDGDGSFRAEQQWPPADSQSYWTNLNVGSYTDDGNNEGTGANGGKGIWSISQPLPYKVWMAGEPSIQVTVNTAVPRANLTADVYDIDEDGRAILISRGTSLVRGAGTQNVFIKMFGEDWPIEAGHRLGVMISSSNAEWWVHVPTETTVGVDAASIGLPFLAYDRTSFLPGVATPKLDAMRGDTVPVSSDTITASGRTFRLPPELIEPDDQQA